MNTWKSERDPAPELATEARIVAMVLGEATEFEEEVLAGMLARSAEMRRWKSWVETMDELLRQVLDPTTKEAGWSLTPEGRRSLLEVVRAHDVSPA